MFVVDNSLILSTPFFSLVFLATTTIVSKRGLSCILWHCLSKQWRRQRNGAANDREIFSRLQSLTMSGFAEGKVS